MEGGPKGPMLGRRTLGFDASSSFRLPVAGMTYTSYTSCTSTQPLGPGSRAPSLLGVIASRREKTVVGSPERERRTTP